MPFTSDMYVNTTYVDDEGIGGRQLQHWVGKSSNFGYSHDLYTDSRLPDIPVRMINIENPNGPGPMGNTEIKDFSDFERRIRKAPLCSPGMCQAVRLTCAST